ncbi:MAG: hypothetical protein ACXAEU_04335 [Candidatus Hodarchaeales archaeon]
MITPSVCLYWYLEDGTLNQRMGRVDAVLLMTQCFSDDENYFLIDKLKNILKTDNRIKLTGESKIILQSKIARKFLKFIGNNSPVRCFDYKFKPRSKKKQSSNKFRNE